MKIHALKSFFLLFLLLSLLALGAALPGDLNRDGRLDIADLVRLKAMLDGLVSPTPEADLNFNGRVDQEDRDLLEAALRGEPLPVFLARSEIGVAGGALQHGDSGFRLTVPAGTFVRDETLVLASIDRQILRDKGLDSPEGTTSLMLFGLPAAEGLEISLPLPQGSRATESHSLVLGSYHLARNAAAADWHFQLLNQPEDGVSRSEGRLIWCPQNLAAQPGTRASSPAESGALILDIERDWLGAVRYSSEHFRIQPLSNSVSAEEIIRMDALLRDLESAFRMGLAMGFPEEKRIEKWGESARQIKVLIKKPDQAKFFGLYGNNEDADSAWCNPPGFWSPPYLELNSGVLGSPTRREIVAHEFLHYLQYCYTDKNSTLWLDEMSATWMEGRVSSQGDNYCPATYKNYRAPINGLYYPSSRFSSGLAGAHGYSISAFAYYLYKRHDWKDDFWFKVCSHEAYARGEGMAPLSSAAASQSPGGLDYLYLVFLRNYLSDAVSEGASGKSVFGNNGQAAIFMFKNYDQNEGDWKRYALNGKESKITTLADMNGKQEHDFQVQDFGAVTWLFNFPEPQQLYEKGLYAKAQVDETCSGLFAVLFEGPSCVGITKIDSVKHDSRKKKRGLNFDLAALENAKRPMSIGLVGVKASSGTQESGALQPLNMSLQILGKISLPAESTYFDLWGERLLQASADLELSCDQVGVLGEYAVSYWSGGATSDGSAHSRFRIVTCQLEENFPLTVRIRSNIDPGVLLEVFGKVPNVEDVDFKATSEPTEEASVVLLYYHALQSKFYETQKFIVPLAELASETGYELYLAPNNATDRIGIEIHPTYTMTGSGVGLGENLTSILISLHPPPPPEPEPETP
ncbi:MAG: hypothetical protein GX901_07465 [Lentisphaerae bacterium]|nr:hypothetical protein [Lentisphaerota bacterium]